MNEALLNYCCSETQITPKAVRNVIELLNDGSTIPFIARYRKEKTGGLDEVEIAKIRDAQETFLQIGRRQQFIIDKIENEAQLTPELRTKIENCFDLIALEDIYLPFKQKRLTKGGKARKNGLEPLAKMILSQRGGNPYDMAERFLKGDISEPAEAIQGAKDIIAEWIIEKGSLRGRLRTFYRRSSTLTSKLIKGKEVEGEKYRDYFDFSQHAIKCPSHRFLAILRGQSEGILSVKCRPDDGRCIQKVYQFFVKGVGECQTIVEEACVEAYRRLLRPSLETELLNKLKEKADASAIQVFMKNLNQLLLEAPLGSKRILAIDPGFRTGCKVVCLDENGELLHNCTIFPHPPQKEAGKAKAKLAQLVEAYKIDAIAVGDGTAGRETERLVKHIKFSKDVSVYVVREDGASIYSASSIARKEFPNYDVTVRGAVSIGRRLMDPLAELVKIDPKSIGVGQYQHDVNQTALKKSLDDAVISCVNKVGVDLNTASPYLLSYVSGLGEKLAENIVAYRSEIGGFTSRSQLKKVPRLGEKAFEQSAGFIRIKDAKNPLDNSAVHPESYALVEKMAKSIGSSIEQLVSDSSQVEEIQRNDFLDIDDYLFNDILSELKKPSRDPRQSAKVLEFDHRLETIEDVQVGMTITGIITNVTNFGAFVNIGIKENGLIHKSNMADRYVEDPSEIVTLHQHVEVQVIEVDVSRKRIGLKLL